LRSLLKKRNKKNLRRIKSILIAGKSKRILIARLIMLIRSKSIISSSKSPILNYYSS